MNIKNKNGQGQEKFQLALIGLKLDGSKSGCERSEKLALRMKLVKVIQGQSQEKFQIAPNRLKLGENKPGAGGSLQNILYGDAQSRLQNFDHLYTWKSVIL